MKTRFRSSWPATFLLLILVISPSQAVFGQDAQVSYKVPPVYLPDLKRPSVQLKVESIKRIGTGFLPRHDGEPFLLNLKEKTSIRDFEGARSEIINVFKLVGLQADSISLQPAGKAITNNAPEQGKLYESYTKQYEDMFQDSLKRKLGKISAATTGHADQFRKEMESEAGGKSTVFSFRELFHGVPIDNALVSYVSREQGRSFITGNVFANIAMTNRERLNETEGTAAALKHIERYSKASEDRSVMKPALVIVPYSDGFRYAWKLTARADDGVYMVWVDADNGKVLQLLPTFSFDSGQGLRFDPSPFYPPVLQSFEVNPPVGGNYSLTLAGVLQVVNRGADGCTGSVTVPGGSGSADFDVSPINSTTNVQNASGAGYNCRFQEVNAFATIYWLRSMYEMMGSQPFPNIVAYVNEAGNSNYYDGANSVHFSIGNATMGNTSHACPNVDKYSGAIDATCMAHEFGHYLNRIQYAVSGGYLHGSVNEGLADWWACTMYNTDTMGAWYCQRCGATQGGYLPRVAESNDVFPEHRYTGGGQAEIHSDGQMICWALWNMRREFLEANALGVLLADIDVIRALTTSGASVLSGISDERVHDSFVDLENQLVSNSGTSWYTEKIVSSFARAGLFASDREAIIDIDDDYLNSNSTVPPTFTVWTGRDYRFSGGNAVTTGFLPGSYNNGYVIEVASDAAFTSNFFSSGLRTDVVSAAGWTASWQLDPAMWNTLKGHDKLYYRVRTMDSLGANIRYSANVGEPGQYIVEAIAAPFAVINESGGCECSCSTGASGNATRKGSLMQFIPAGLLFIIPFAYAFYRRRRAAKRIP